MSVQEWAGLTLTILSIAGVVFAGLRWYIELQTSPVKEEIASIKEAINDVRKETKTNGGSSMRDEIKFIKSNQAEHIKKQDIMDSKLTHMYDILLEYIAKERS